jgi:hypothetical protein
MVTSGGVVNVWQRYLALKILPVEGNDDAEIQ